MGMKWEGKGFMESLPKIYAIYTGGFLAFFALMAFFETLGMSAKWIGILFVLFTLVVYAFIGVLSRTTAVEAYYVAGRSVPPVFNGMATAADWMSGASFVAMAGGIFMSGHPYMAFIVGWTGGYILIATLMAPYLRKFGCYTVPDFIGTRYGGKLTRFCAIVVLVVASFTYVTAQITATGTIAARAFQIPFEVGVWLGLFGILVCSMLGGMRAVTWTQVAQYIVLIVAYLIPIFWMSIAQGFGWLPHLEYGAAVQRIMELEPIIGVGTAPTETVAGLKALTTLHATPPEGALAAWKFVTLVFCMMVGTASLPHILMRYFTTPSVRDARNSVAWSLFFIFLLYFSAPALATFSKLQMIDPNLPTSIIGASVDHVMSLEWIQKWSAIGLLAIKDSNADGHPADQRVLPEPGHHRAGDAGDGRPAVRDLRPGRGRRHGGGDVHRRRPAAGDGQHAVARPVLQDHRPEGRGEEAPDDVAHPAADHRRRRRGGREPQAHRHPRRGRLGVLLRDVGPVRPAGARRVVEARQSRRAPSPA